ncbi:MAG: chemotaxis protein CheD [Alphaproteobacteria bacterium]|nr:chemotaxis protein CheD [Alphaproteobacteria bacterium]
MSAAQAPAPKEKLLHVVQGSFAVVDDPNLVLTTILGSCVAACIRDPVARVGGMNHFLLPGDGAAHGDSVKYGINSMELLINGMLQRGANRARLEAKLFGGARVVQNLSDVGRQNAEFAERFLRSEGITCVGQSMGGDRARRIRYWPMSGRAVQMLLDRSESHVFKEERAAPPPKPERGSGELELF